MFDVSFRVCLLRGRGLVLFRSDSSTNSRVNILRNKITILFIYIKQKKDTLLKAQRELVPRLRAP